MRRCILCDRHALYRSPTTGKMKADSGHSLCGRCHRDSVNARHAVLMVMRKQDRYFDVGRSVKDKEAA